MTIVFILYHMLFLHIVGRRTWVQDESPHVRDIIEKFPPLKKVKYVSFVR